MVYTSLKPTTSDVDSDDANSIQLSPQLNTESHFSFNHADASHTSPFEAVHDSFETAAAQNPYQDRSKQELLAPVEFDVSDHLYEQRSRRLDQSADLEFAGQAEAGAYYGAAEYDDAGQLVYNEAYVAYDGTHNASNEQSGDGAYKAYGNAYEGYEASYGELHNGSAEAHARNSNANQGHYAEPEFKAAKLTRSTRKQFLKQHQLPSGKEAAVKDSIGQKPILHDGLQGASPDAQPSQEATQDSDNLPELNFQERKYTRRMHIPASMPPPREDEDPLPFEATRVPSARPHSMVLSSGPVMSSETFESYRKSMNSLKDDSDDSVTGELLKDENEEDEFDVKEQRRRSAIMRQEQDARMSVYRQKMTKLVGNISPSDRRSIGLDSGEQDEQDDIPLSILQAHKFPRSHSPRGLNLRGLTPPGVSSHSTSPKASETPYTPRSASPGPRPHSIASTSALNRQTPRGLASPLPAVFGTKNKAAPRGLVGEISRGEDLKRRRQTFGYTNVPSPTTHHNPEILEMQTKLDQVLSLLSNMTPPSAAQSFQGSLHSPLATPSYKGNDSVVSLPPHAYNRAQSIRSSQSLGQAMSSPVGYSPRPASYGAFSRRPAGSSPAGYSPGPAGYSPAGHSPAGHSPAGYSPGRTSYSPAGYSPNFGTPSVRSIPPLPRGRLPAQKGANRPAGMRIIHKDDEDEDDHDELQQILEKRRRLRDEWSQSQATESSGASPTEKAVADEAQSDETTGDSEPVSTSV